MLATLLLEGLTQPRTTYFMSTLDRLEEIVVAVVALLGLLASGAFSNSTRDFNGGFTGAVLTRTWG